MNNYLLMLRKGFFLAPKSQKTAIAARLNTTRQAENHPIVTKTGLMRHINYYLQKANTACTQTNDN